MHFLYCLFCDVALGSGAIYTRWGRKTCPGGEVDLVYSGKLNKLFDAQYAVDIHYGNHNNIWKSVVVITIIFESIF